MNMKRNGKRDLLAGSVFLTVFLLWTIMIQCIDVQATGPNGTKVGFAEVNGWFHRMTGVHLTLYKVTDWLGIVPIIVCLCFAGLGFLQLVKRRSFRKVDADILLLGVYYVAVIGAYFIFEWFPVNYRPVLIDGFLEASYPSSTTLLVLSVMPTLKFQIDRRIGNAFVRNAAGIFVILFSAFMAIGRLISGVHWVTDIVGSVLLSAGLFLLYRYVVTLVDERREGTDGIQ